MATARTATASARSGSSVENGFCRSEDVLDLEQLAISQHGGERAQGGVGAKDIEAVISGVVRHPLVVDLEVLFVRGLEIASIGAVADQRLVAAAQAYAPAAQHALPHLGIAPGFSEIAADHIAALVDPHLLGLEFGVRTPGPGNDERNARLGVLQDGVVHFLGRAVAP